LRVFRRSRSVTRARKGRHDRFDAAANAGWSEPLSEGKAMPV
jgi:hypothetical protein